VFAGPIKSRLAANPDLWRHPRLHGARQERDPELGSKLELNGTYVNRNCGMRSMTRTENFLFTKSALYESATIRIDKKDWAQDAGGSRRFSASIPHSRRLKRNALSSHRADRLQDS